MTLPELLGRRHAVRRFIPGAADPAALDHALRAAVLAPTAFNAQPWRALVIEGDEPRATVAGSVYSSTNVAEAGHLVLFTHVTGAGALELDAHAARVAGQRGLARPEAVQKLRDGYARDIEGKSPAGFDAWARAQTYLALGLFLAAAALGVVGGVLLAMKPGSARSGSSKYETPEARREGVEKDLDDNPGSGRVLWDALDAGVDPTDRDAGEGGQRV